MLKNGLFDFFTAVPAEKIAALVKAKPNSSRTYAIKLLLSRVLKPEDGLTEASCTLLLQKFSKKDLFDYLEVHLERSLPQRSTKEELIASILESWNAGAVPHPLEDDGKEEESKGAEPKSLTDDTPLYLLERYIESADKNELLPHMFVSPYCGAALCLLRASWLCGLRCSQQRRCSAFPLGPFEAIKTLWASSR